MQSPTLALAPQSGPAHFRSSRVFYHAALGGHEGGWCFAVRGGHAYGPFPERDLAERMLTGLVDKFRRTGDTGGR